MKEDVKGRGATLAPYFYCLNMCRKRELGEGGVKELVPQLEGGGGDGFAKDTT